MNKTLKTIFYIFVDIVAILVAWIVSLAILSSNVGKILSKDYFVLIGGVALVLITNTILGLYKKAWKYASVGDGIRLVVSALVVLVYNVVFAIIINEENSAIDLSIEWAILTAGFYFVILTASRFFYRVNSFLSLGNVEKSKNNDKNHRVLIVGAGDAGVDLYRDLIKASSPLNPVCFVDDDKSKVGLVIGKIKVAGTTEDIPKLVEKYNIEEVVIAIPSAKRNEINRIFDIAKTAKCKVKIVPGISQLASGEVSISRIKDVSINDLLGREPIKVNLDEIMGYIEGKVILVTGGGGSIGSELCRQIAKHNPAKLIILDIYENNAYDIQQELKRRYTNLDLVTLIASVRDRFKIEKVFETYKPEIVFHAAAHKHVPLMEVSPNEAIKNNVGGTFNVADCAGIYGAKRFILISTDKAVNPTNVMGATKRMCEMIVQSLNKKYKTEYVAVRFGNVLGSNGSVIPLFKKQIEEGGPVTVTHEKIIRYFMTIPEAVSLVLQAGAYAKGGEIFVLDMGEPVKIYDLAVNLIKLSGLTPFEDIDIKITGLRPGEKLYEERLMSEEGLERTPNKMISIGKPIKFDEEEFLKKIEDIRKEAYTEPDDIRKAIHDIVPTYKMPEKKVD